MTRSAWRHLVFPLALIFVVLVGGFGLFMLLQQRDYVNQSGRQVLKEASDDVTLGISQQVEMLDVAGAILVQNADFLTALESRNREQMLAFVLPLYNKLKRDGERIHIYLLDAQQFCLLRTHQPDKYGDKINRVTAQRAQRTGQVAHGVELGSSELLMLRVVRPVYRGEYLLGYLELSTGVDAIYRQVKQHMNVEILITLDKNNLHRATWEVGMRQLGQNPEWDRYARNALVYSTFATLPEGLEVRLGQSLHHAGALEDVTLRDSAWWVKTEPIPNTTDAGLGTLILVRDISTEVASFKRQRNWALVGGVVLSGGLMGLVFQLLRRTDRQVNQQQTALYQQEEHYHSLFEGSPNCVHLLNRAGELLAMNKNGMAALGRADTELLGRTYEELWDASSRPIVRAALAQVLRGEEATFEAAYSHPDGTVMAWQVILKLVRTGAQELPSLMGVATNITEYKNIQKTLTHERERLAHILTGTNVGTWEWNVQTGAAIFDERWAEIVGYSLAELAPISIQTWMGLVHPEDSKVSAELLQRHFRRELDYYECTCRMKHKAGHWVWVLDRGCVASWTPEGKPLMMFGTHQDVTQRQEQEHALRMATERLALAMRVGGVGIWDWDPVTKRMDWDDQLYALYGGSADYFGTPEKAWEDCIHPEDKMRYQQEYDAALRGEMEFDLEYRIIRPNGTLRNIRAMAAVLRDPQGKPVRMIGINWDITAQKHAEVALWESAANFRSFFEAMSDLILVATAEGKIVFNNQAVTRKLGYTDVELQKMNMLELHPPEVRQEAGEIFAAMFRGERNHGPLPLRGKDGQLLPVETRIWPGKWDGQDCIFGICKDLSAEQDFQQRFEHLFRNNPTIMALSAVADRRFVDVNDTFLEVLGYSRKEVIDKTAAELNLFVDPQRHHEMSTQLIGTEQIKNCEMQIRRKDGTILEGLFWGEVVRSQGQHYLLTVMIDITERKQIAEKLSRMSVIQKALMSLATNFVNVPWALQESAINQSLATMGRLIDADRAYLFSYDFNSQTTSNTHEWCADGITPEIHNLQQLPITMLHEWLEAHTQGQLVHIPSVAALPLADSVRQVLVDQGIKSLITLPLLLDGRCMGFVGFDAVRYERVWGQEEISLLQVLAELYAHFEARRNRELENRALQERLTQALDTAQQAVGAKSMFLANMSHEIRTPLNAILGYSQIMERECRQCPSGRWIPSLSKSGEHLLELINDVLDLARSDTQKINLQPQEFDFKQMLDDVRMMFSHRPEAQPLVVDLVYQPGVPQNIYADAGKIRQILINLVGNAIKFTKQGAVTLVAALETTQADNKITLVVDVRDTGCGIRTEDISHVFDLFYRVEDRTRTGQGTGLGLPLSQRYAQALGGDVTVTSEVGVGSCFHFTFVAQQLGQATMDSTAQRNVLRLAPGQPPYRVLIVDDDAPSRNMTMNLLQSVGFVLESVTGGAAAVQRMQSAADPMAVILMDIHMPEMDGYETIRQIRALPNGAQVKILMVSASGLVDQLEHAQTAGADGNVPKPIHREELLAAIAQVTGVRYEYDPEPAIKVQSSVPGRDLTAEVARLSARLRVLLEQALRRGDVALLRATLEAIAYEQPKLARSLGTLANKYDYDGIRSLLHTKKAVEP